MKALVDIKEKDIIITGESMNKIHLRDRERFTILKSIIHDHGELYSGLKLQNSCLLGFSNPVVVLFDLSDMNIKKSI